MRPVIYAAGAFGGAAAAVMGTAVGYGTMLGTMPRECPHCAGEDGTRAPRSKAAIASSGVTAGGTAVEEALRRKAYDALAPTFDDELEWHEFLTGIKLMRWWMMRQARGDVLEVAAGTGRNFGYYPKGTKLTATDCSPAMVEVARTKAAGECESSSVDVRVEDVQARKGMGFKAGSFDTVVDTFGLCSYEDPVAALREMARVCKRGDERGRILLIEHGRSQSHAWLTNILDKHARPHAAKWGCYWNRDIVGIVKEAGLTIVQRHEFHFGTTQLIVAEST